MSKKLRRVDAKGFKTALQAGREHVKNLLMCKATVPVIEKDATNPLLQTWVISTAAVDRDNDTIDPNGWDLGPYKENPVILWAHNHGAEILPPIGRSLAVYVEDGKLKARAEFASRDVFPFAGMVAELAAQGFINACSVGFIPHEWKETADRPGWMPMDFSKAELLEWSPCPVGSNPEALIEARSKGIDLAPMAEFASKALDRSDDSGLWLPRDDMEKLYRAAKGDAPATIVISSAVPPAAASEAETDTPAASANPPVAAVAAEPQAKDSPAVEPKTEIKIEAVAPAVKAIDRVAELAKEMRTQTDSVVERVAESVNDVVAVQKVGRVLSAANEEKLRSAYEMIGAVLAQVEQDPDGDGENETDSAPPAETKTEPDTFRLVVNEPDPEPAQSKGLTKGEIAQVFKEVLQEQVDASIRRRMGRVD